MKTLTDIGNAELLAAEGQHQLAMSLVTWLAGIFPIMSRFAASYVAEGQKRGVNALH